MNANEFISKLYAENLKMPSGIDIEVYKILYIYYYRIKK